ncbi:hypothetical protein EYF80_039466 [Liparis tanakae]|uniref:Uncharacterized protein n=1 Tax=Liparis tanakae TaxID=230148 RepID=A0A4Z2GA06_9TELE|nr:hypothetical protein EYF80_039466 [Liparis tanakae]
MYCSSLGNRRLLIEPNTLASKVKSHGDLAPERSPKAHVCRHRTAARGPRFAAGGFDSLLKVHHERAAR